MSTTEIINVAELFIAAVVASIVIRYVLSRRKARGLGASHRRSASAADAESGTRVLRYHPLLVLLHWLVAFAMAQLLFRGAFIMARIPNSDPAKIDGLRAHMLAGSFVLVLMLARLVLRKVTTLPPPASPRNPHLDRLKKIVMPLLYLCVICQASAGLGMAYQAGLPDILFGGHGTLPESFWVYPLRSVHYVFSRLLMALIGIHLGGVLYHTLFLRDGLLCRVGFGHRVVTASSQATLEPHR